MVFCRLWFCLAAVAWAVVACGPSGSHSPNLARDPVAASASTAKVFQVRGVITDLLPERKEVSIKHDEIPGFMPAMTMPFHVKDTNVMKGFQPGDVVRFRLLVTDDQDWIEDLARISESPSREVPSGPPETGPFRHVREVEPLEIGQPLPDYPLTNQFGEAFSTRRYLGQPFAITFIFTRCPLPTFCPRMSTQFSEAQKALASGKSGLTNWSLLTVSFDPEFDTPTVLKAYAQGHSYDPAHWTFATGSLLELTALGEQLGLIFWRDPQGSISHNLRTAVFDSAGRLQRLFEGNQWTSEDLVREFQRSVPATSSPN